MGLRRQNEKRNDIDQFVSGAFHLTFASCQPGSLYFFSTKTKQTRGARARAARKTSSISRIQGKICTESNASLKLDSAKRQLFSLQSILPFFESSSI
jgi:hypothetical protein